MLTIYVVERKDKAEKGHTLHSLPLKFHLQRVEIINVEDDLHKAFWEITELEPKLVFVELDDFDEAGLHFARQLNQLKHPPQIVFIASNDTYVQQAIEMAAFDYVIKPFESDWLKKMMYEHDQLRLCVSIRQRNQMIQKRKSKTM